MGPEATAEFYKRVIKIIQEKYGARYDYEYPEMIIVNLPIPDIVEDVKNRKIILKLLKSALQKLEFLDCDLISVPCNTINIFFEDMRSYVKIPILNIVEEVKKEINFFGYKKVVILATNTTIKEGLYEYDSFQAVYPDKGDQKKVNEIILNIMSGKKPPSDRKSLIKMIRRLYSQGAECVVLGCTELSLILQKNNTRYKIIDSLNVLAASTIKIAFKEATKNKSM